MRRYFLIAGIICLLFWTHNSKAQIVNTFYENIVDQCDYDTCLKSNRKIIHDRTSRIDELGNAASGMYFLHLSDKNGQINTSKLIKL